MDRPAEELSEKLNTFRRSGETVWNVTLYSEIDRDFGREVLERFAVAFSGTQLFVPKHYDPDHRLVSAVGEATARELIARYGGCVLDVPAGLLGAQAFLRRRGIEMLKAGHSINETTRALQVSRSTVKNWKKRYVRGTK